MNNDKDYDALRSARRFVSEPADRSSYLKLINQKLPDLLENIKYFILGIGLWVLMTGVFTVLLTVVFGTPSDTQSYINTVMFAWLPGGISTLCILSGMGLQYTIVGTIVFSVVIPAMFLLVTSLMGKS